MKLTARNQRLHSVGHNTLDDTSGIKSLVIYEEKSIEAWLNNSNVITLGDTKLLNKQNILAKKQN